MKAHAVISNGEVMKRIIIFSVLILMISCSKNDPIQTVSEKTHFNGSVNNDNWESDGLAYLRENSIIHIRGFLGTAGSHYQIDIVLKNNTAGTYFLDSSVVSASVSNVIGMDGIGATYNPKESSYIHVEYDNKFEYVTGELIFNGFSQNDLDSINIISNFKLKIGESYTSWTCDFTNEGISNCRFLK